MFGKDESNLPKGGHCLIADFVGSEALAKDQPQIGSLQGEAVTRV